MRTGSNETNFRFTRWDKFLGSSIYLLGAAQCPLSLLFHTLKVKDADHMLPEVQCSGTASFLPPENRDFHQELSQLQAACIETKCNTFLFTELLRSGVLS